MNDRPRQTKPSHDWLLGLVLFAAVALVYTPVWWGGFIWDDDGRITANPCIIGPLGLKEIWTTSAADLCPMVYTTFWMEYALWGLDPLPYHLVNVALQGVCAILLWRVLRGLAVPGAWLGAALWALHPVQVESVAWITEMKNTQSGMFFLLAILFYVRRLKALEAGESGASRWNYAWTLLWAALAMVSKSSTVVLPLVLALCSWMMERRWQWRRLLELLPFFLLAVAPSILTLWTQGLLEHGQADKEYERGLAERLATAGATIWFYLGKLIWPHPLIFIYPRWKMDAGSWISYLPSLTALVALVLLWRARAPWARACFWAYAYFLVALLPVIGLIDGFFWRYSLVGDHFQYLASMGPLALAGAAMQEFRKPIVRGSLAAGLLLILGIMSWQRAWVYQNIETLWSDTIRQNPTCWLAHNNLGNDDLARGRVAEAQAEFKETLRLKPDCEEARNNLTEALFQTGHLDEALALSRHILETTPDYADARVNYANFLLHQGKVEEAMAEYQKVLAIDPESYSAYNNIGDILLRRGQVDDAVRHYEQALALNPNFAQAHYNLGSVLLQLGRVDEAIARFQEALVINPYLAQAHNNLGLALAVKGRQQEAMAEYQRALALAPDSAKAHYNYANILLQQGRMAEAIPQFREALRLNPNEEGAHRNLGAALFQVGQREEAEVELQVAVKMNPQDEAARKALATVRAFLHPPSGQK